MPLLLLCSNLTYIDMKIVSVETDLPLVFLDSYKWGAGKLVYYQFDLQPEAPLRLVEVVVSNENELKSFKYFDVRDYSVHLEAEPSDEWFQDSVELNSKTSLMMRDALEGRHWKEKSSVETNFFEEDDLNALFKFEEGVARVQYQFFGRESRVFQSIAPTFSAS